MNQKELAVITSKGKGIASVLESNLDNVNAKSFDNLESFKKYSETYNYYPHRIMLVSSVLIMSSEEPEDILDDLYSFIQNESETTEVILVARPEDKELCDTFKNIFTSDRHSPSIRKSWSANAFSEVAVSSSLELVALYEAYTPPEDDNHKSGNPIGNILGGIRKKYLGAEAETSKVETPEEPVKEVEEVVEVESKSEPQQEEQIPEEPGASDLEFLPEDESNLEFSQVLSEETPSLYDSSNEVFEMLSLGEAGAEHIETGFLDDSDESLGKPAEEQFSGYSGEGGPAGTEGSFEEPGPATQIDPVVVVDPDSVYRQTVAGVVDVSSEDSGNAPQRVQEPHTQSTVRGGLNLITGLRGTKTYEYCVFEAMRSPNPLIVDLDYLQHGVLSTIDMNEFYKGNHSIGSLNTYQESTPSGILSFLSDGFSREPDNLTKAAVSISMQEAPFSHVFMDSPLDSLGIVADMLPKSINITVLVEGSYAGFLETIKQLEEAGNEFADLVKENGAVFKVIRNGPSSAEELKEVGNQVSVGKLDWYRYLSEGISY